MASKLRIAMFPWFAFGHFTPYLHLANELAKRGHEISYLLPQKAIPRLEQLNLHPDLISFHGFDLPQVDGLPNGAQTGSDIPFPLHSHLATAMDLMQRPIEDLLVSLKPDFVLYDLAYWIPQVSSKHGVKSLCFIVLSAATFAIGPVPARLDPNRKGEVTAAEMEATPPGYPSATVVLKKHENSSFILFKEFGRGVTLFERLTTALKNCDAICIRTCRELEGIFCDYIASQFGNPVLLTGPVLPEPEKGDPEDRWVRWLDGFDPGSVVFCAFGSQNTLQKDQFQEIVLGFEMTGLPFLVALTPPSGTSSIQEALPEGFEERVGGRGVVCGEWVPQPQILAHPSVGCFVSHCGFGSMWESLIHEPQIVLLPNLKDQILNTRLLSEELKVAVEVEKEENGWVCKEKLSKAIKSTMEADSELGCLIKKNHAKWRKTLTSPGFMSNYIDNFIKNLHEL